MTDIPTELIHGCLHNNRRCQEKLYNTYSPMIYGICKRYINDDDEAQEVLQIIFIRVFDKLHTYEFKGSFQGWLRRTAITVILNHIRNQRKHKYHTDIDEVYDIPSDITTDQNITRQELLHALHLLPTGYRTVFNLFTIEGFQHKEIAKMLGIKSNTSKSQLSKARKKLKNILIKFGYNEIM